MPTRSAEIVTMTLLRYRGAAARWWAFTQMGLGPGRFRGVGGLQTAKMLGSGAGNGFSILPNLGVYALLGVWTDEAAAHTFFATHPWWAAARRRSVEQYTVFMRTAVVHGEWGGEHPFQITTEFVATQPVAVITRATIKLRHLFGFWRFVPSVSAFVKDRPGQLLSIGVGEWPLFMQATFSVWTSAEAMMDYAYRNPHHQEVIRKTRELGWYQEELFARFHPYASAWSWAGLARSEGKP